MSSKPRTVYLAVLMWTLSQFLTLHPGSGLALRTCLSQPVTGLLGVLLLCDFGP